MKWRTNIAIGIFALTLLISGYYCYIHYFFDFSPVGNLFVNQLGRIESASAALEQASVIVNYDDRGKIWLTGRSINDTRTFTVDELSPALTAIQPKGSAFIAHAYTDPNKGIGGLLGPPPPSNLELETKIRNALITAGFNSAPTHQQ
jgi:hypothetical protein